MCLIPGACGLHHNISLFYDALHLGRYIHRLTVLLSQANTNHHQSDTRISSPQGRTGFSLESQPCFVLFVYMPQTIRPYHTTHNPFSQVSTADSHQYIWLISMYVHHQGHTSIFLIGKGMFVMVSSLSFFPVGSSGIWWSPILFVFRCPVITCPFT